MKNILSYIFVFVMAAMLTGCEGRPGRDGVDGVLTHSHVVVVNVPASSWQYSGMENNNYFVASVDMKDEITEDAFDKGMIKVYRTYNYDKQDASQIALPYVRSFEEPYTDELQQIQWKFYTESIDYEVFIGKLVFYYTRSDFEYELDPTMAPVDMQFRVVVMY